MELGESASKGAPRWQTSDPSLSSAWPGAAAMFVTVLVPGCLATVTAISHRGGYETKSNQIWSLLRDEAGEEVMERGGVGLESETDGKRCKELKREEGERE